MTRNFIKYFFAGVLLTSVISCKKNNVVIDQDPLTPPEAARFVMAPLSSNSYYSYFILETPAPGSPFNIPLGVTNVSSSDRKVSLTYTSRTATAGTQFTAPTEVTIPAGQALVNVPFQGIFANYPTGRRDTVKVRITNTAGSINKNAYQDSLMLVIQKYCTVILDDLDGVFNNTRETNSSGGSPYGPYSSTVALSPIAGSTTKANITFGQFWDYPIEVTGTIDWTNPAAFAVVIPRQYTGLDYDAGQPIDVRTSPGQISTFSSCDQSYSLTVDFIVNNYPSAGSSAYYSQNYKIYIKR